MTSLRDQIGKRQAFDPPQEEVYLNLVRTAAVLATGFHRLFKKFGLAESSYNVLRILRAAGEAGRTWTDIRDELVVPAPDVTRLIARLEREGHLCRERSIEDRRVVRVFITPSGKKLVDDLDEPIRRLHLAQLGHLNAGEMEKLNALLERARNPIESR